MNPHYYILPGLKYPAVVTSPANETIDKICTYYGVTFEQLKSRNRKRELVVPRQIAMTALYLCHRYSFASAGKEFDRDHTTAIHSLQVVKNLSETDSDYKETLKTLCPTILASLSGRRDYVL